MGDGRCVAGVDEPAAVRAFVPLGALVGRFTDDTLNSPGPPRAHPGGGQMVDRPYHSNNHECPMMVEMRVQTQEVIVGVAVTKAVPRSPAGVASVPPTLIGSAGCSAAVRVRGRASKRSARYR